MERKILSAYEFDDNISDKAVLDSETLVPSAEPKKKILKKPRLFKASKCDPTELEDNVGQVLLRFRQGCECQDDQCFKGLKPESVYRHRLNIAELTKAEHDMYLMGVTMACLTDPNQTARNTERRRLRAQYVYQGRRVCLDAFLYLENCTHYQIKRIRKHLVTHGVTPRVHGNHGKIPHNTFSLDIYKIATEFLKNFIGAQETKQKLKAARNAPLYLPPEITRKTLHDLYNDYCKKISPTIKVLGYSTFRRFMKVQFPQVKFAKLEFVVRPTAQSVAKAKNDLDISEVDNLQFIDNTDFLPIVLDHTESNTYLVTPMDSLQDGLSYQLTSAGELFVNRSDLPVTVTSIDSI